MSVHDDVRAEIEALAAASKYAMARNDLDAVLATMTDDVVLLSAAGPPVVGREALRQMYSGLAGSSALRTRRRAPISQRMLWGTLPSFSVRTLRQ